MGGVHAAKAVKETGIKVGASLIKQKRRKGPHENSGRAEAGLSVDAKQRGGGGGGGDGGGSGQHNGGSRD